MGLLSKVTTHVFEELTKQTNNKKKTPTNLSNILCTKSVFSHPTSNIMKSLSTVLAHIALLRYGPADAAGGGTYV